MYMEQSFIAVAPFEWPVAKVNICESSGLSVIACVYLAPLL